jgi:bifunctional non-homologous end joining protein LigD
VKEQGLEGLVAKRRDSKYEAGERSGAWAKMHVNRSEEFVIGGYTVGG